MNSVTSLYLHFPFCKHLCNYCDFYKHKLESMEQVESFESLLLKQIDHHESYLNKNQQKLAALETFYIGGGTPSLWGRRGALFLQKCFSNTVIKLAENCEFTIEIDPDCWTEDEIEQWISIGVNRFSVGSQAFNDKFIKMMDRTHLLADVEKTIKYLGERDLNFSVDLMLGLPNSEDRDIEEELNRLIKYRPKHISVYILKTRKNYPLTELIPNDEHIRKEYLKTSEVLTSAGFEHYEVSNFAKKGYKSKHNIRYWNYEGVGALGPNATGLIVQDDKAIRYQWKSVKVGVEEEVIEGESLIIEKLFLGLRYESKFNLKSLFEDRDIKKLEKVFEKWRALNYLRANSSLESVNLNALGYLMCDSLIDDIFNEVEF